MSFAGNYYDACKRITELADDLAEWKEAHADSEHRATAWGNAANERAARIRELEVALQLRCPQCDMRLIERTALETGAKDGN